MNTKDKTVAIIGGGPSGLVSAKSSIECGLLPTIFEKNLDIGGIWSNSNTKVWDSMKTNVTKYFCGFSDFSIDDNTDENSLFLKQSQVFNYLYKYAENFNLLKHINYNSTVLNVSRVIIDEKDNNKDKWKIQWIVNNNKNINNNEKDQLVLEKIFDFVIIATGVNSKEMTYDKMEILNNFKGGIIHSKDYKSPDSYKDKRVLIIGNSFSGSQIATELTNYALSVHQTVRRKNQWIIPEVVNYNPPNTPSSVEINAPLDILFYIRKQSYENSKLPREQFIQLFNNILKQLSKNNLNSDNFKYDSNDFNNPPYLLLAGNEYIPLVDNGKIKLLRNFNIHSANGNEITMISNDNNNQEKYHFDEIILSTGYETDLSFLDKEIQDEIKYMKNDSYVSCLLYKNVFPKNLKNIGFVGIATQLFFSLMELMARWVTMVFSGIINLPSGKEFDDEINRQLEIRNSDIKNKFQFPYINPVIHSDEIAKEIGCLPNFEEIKLNDPELYDILWNSFFCNAGFRLDGPFSNVSTAKKILNQYNNIFKKIMQPKLNN
ncbi:hypothetical protein ACTFIV_010641 [Dictyostelium citrinum]